MRRPTAILGLNAYHGDAAAALMIDGHVVAAIAEERLNRDKHCAGFPTLAIARVLADAGVSPEQLTAIAVGRDRRAHRGRKLAYAALHAASVARWAGSQRRVRAALADPRPAVAAACGLNPTALAHVPVDSIEHHSAHAACAFYASNHKKAAVFTADGFGDFVSTTWGVGAGTQIQIAGRVFFPHSLGVLYQAATQFIGFKHFGDEGKTMGLAPYGTDRFVGTLRDAVRLQRDGSFRLNLSWFRHPQVGGGGPWLAGAPTFPDLFSDRWLQAFGPPGIPGEARNERDADVAYAVQAVLEEVLAHVFGTWQRRTGLQHATFAGGVALNGVANGKLARLSGFETVSVFPAAGDDGLAVGAAWASYVRRSGQRPAAVAVPLWGPRFTDVAAACDLAAAAATPGVHVERLDHDTVRERAADALAAGRIVGWFRGAMEFGPRALGARSILAHPGDAATRERLNARIKRREPFRPFAPAVLLSAAKEWFVDPPHSPAMLHVVPVQPQVRTHLAAVTHVDGSARIQTVDPAEHPQFAALLTAFAQRTGIPVLLNTSFNENEPIVCTPQEALDCFLRTDMDALALEDVWIHRDVDQTSNP